MRKIDAFLGLSLLACLSLAGCAAPSAAPEETDTQVDGYSSRGTRSAAPLSGDELSFEQFLHVDASTSSWSSHSYADYSERVRAGSKTIALGASLYLERDRTFTLYYSEIELTSEHNGFARTQRKLAGTWRANGNTLELGTTASATLTMVHDSWNQDVEGLSLVMPEGWATADVAGDVLLTQGGSNVGPKAPFWSDHR